MVRLASLFFRFLLTLFCFSYLFKVRGERKTETERQRETERDVESGRKKEKKTLS
jgi:hypothetical protein